VVEGDEEKQNHWHKKLKTEASELSFPENGCEAGDTGRKEHGVGATDEIEYWNDGETSGSASDKVGTIEAGDVAALASEDD
jgi:hypothetical protein